MRRAGGVDQMTVLEVGDDRLGPWRQSSATSACVEQLSVEHERVLRPGAQLPRLPIRRASPTTQIASYLAEVDVGVGEEWPPRATTLAQRAAVRRSGSARSRPSTGDRSSASGRSGRSKRPYDEILSQAGVTVDHALVDLLAAASATAGSAGRRRASGCGRSWREEVAVVDRPLAELGRRSVLGSRECPPSSLSRARARRRLRPVFVTAFETSVVSLPARSRTPGVDEDHAPRR